MLQQFSNHGVSRLVIGENFFLLRIDDPAHALGAGHDPIERLLEVALLNLRMASPRREKGGFVQHVREIGAGESWSALCKHFKVDVGVERFAFGMDLKNLMPSVCVWHIDDDLPVE